MKSVFLIIAFLLLGCNLKQDSKQVEELNDGPILDKNRVDRLRNSILKNPDEYTYGRILDFYTYNNEEKNMKEFLEVSIKMANQNNLCDSNFEVYKTTIRLYNKGFYHDSLFGKLPKKEKKMAFSYIKKGVELNSISCLGVLEMMYRHGYGVPKNRKISDSLYNLFYEKYNFYPSKIGRED